MSTTVGQELLEVPFPEMVANLAFGVAAAQAALDKNSVATAKTLGEEEVELIPFFEEKEDPENGTRKLEPGAKVKMSLLQVGLNPTFYQFSESVIEVTMDIKTNVSEDSTVKTTAEAHIGWGCWGASVKTEAEYSRKFGKEVHGTSKLMVKMVPVAPPPRLYPPIIPLPPKKE